MTHKNTILSSPAGALANRVAALGTFRAEPGTKVAKHAAIIFRSTDRRVANSSMTDGIDQITQRIPTGGGYYARLFRP